MRFLYTISHVPGKELAIADALSCALAAATLATSSTLESETAAYIDFIVKNLPASEQWLKEIKECQEAGPVCQQIVELCLSGWPAKQSLPAELKPYHTVSAELAVENGLLL